MKKAVVLLSGGLDSATVLAIVRNLDFECHALSLDYGQRHRSELTAARNIARSLNAKAHLIIPLDLTVFGGSALIDQSIVPRSSKRGARAFDLDTTLAFGRLEQKFGGRDHEQ